MAVKDWYTELRLPPDVSTDQIREAVERRSRQAAALANTAPERSQQLREQVRAIKRDLLSGDEARQRYDASRQAGVDMTSPLQQNAAATDRAPFWTQAAPEETSDRGYPDAQPHGYPAAQYPYPTEHQRPHATEQQHPYPGDQQAYGPPDYSRRRPGRLLKFLQSGWTCPTCGEGGLPSDQFCAQCGTRLKAGATYKPVTAPVEHPNACPYCGTIATSNSRFCRTCGAARPH